MYLREMINNEIPNIEDILVKPEFLLSTINEIVHQHKMNYLEATVYYCEKNNYDLESISKIIPQSLRTLIEESAKELRLFKKIYNQNNTLPI
jgi:hypothetical protein